MVIWLKKVAPRSLVGHVSRHEVVCSAFTITRSYHHWQPVFPFCVDYMEYCRTENGGALKGTAHGWRRRG